MDTEVVTNTWRMADASTRTHAQARRPVLPMHAQTIHGHVQAHMDMCKHTWTCASTHGHMQAHMDMCKHTWTCASTHGHVARCRPAAHSSAREASDEAEYDGERRHVEHRPLEQLTKRAAIDEAAEVASSRSRTRRGRMPAVDRPSPAARSSAYARSEADVGRASALA